MSISSVEDFIGLKWVCFFFFLNKLDQWINTWKGTRQGNVWKPVMLSTLCHFRNKQSKLLTSALSRIAV